MAWMIKRLLGLAVPEKIFVHFPKKSGVRQAYNFVPFNVEETLPISNLCPLLVKVYTRFGFTLKTPSEFSMSHNLMRVYMSFMHFKRKHKKRQGKILRLVNSATDKL
jgi:hypothetical protein